MESFLPLGQCTEASAVWIKSGRLLVGSQHDKGRLSRAFGASHIGSGVLESEKNDLTPALRLYYSLTYYSLTK